MLSQLATPVQLGREREGLPGPTLSIARKLSVAARADQQAEKRLGARPSLYDKADPRTARRWCAAGEGCGGTRPLSR